MSLVLVTGGVRCGKSRFAQRLAERAGSPVTFVATAARDAADAEWEARLAHHRRTRPQAWELVETAGGDACRLAALLRVAPAGRTLLVDSLGTWLADRMANAHRPLAADAPALERALAADGAALVAAAAACRAHTVVVGEEVGSGIVPAYASGRIFRDVLGRLQQSLGARADAAYFVVAGFAIDLIAAAHEDGLRPPVEGAKMVHSDRQDLPPCARGIVAVDAGAAAAARARVDTLTKPLGALGRLEDVAVALSAIAGRLPERAYDATAVLVAAADHGVSAEGVSAYPDEVTGQMIAAFTGGYAAINAFARTARADVFVADFGVRTRPPPHPALIDARIGPGTANLAREAAMTDDQVDAALAAGNAVFDRLLAHRRYDVLALGEMGIANTTSAAAIVAALTQSMASDVCGRGTGIDEAGLERKIAAVESALGRFEARDWRTVAREVGGFEIVGLAGVMLAAARSRVPVVLDGFIVAAAALLAQAIVPEAAGYWLAAHLSTERGHRAALKALGLRPLLALDLRLGEATGAALALPLVEAASRMIVEMKTFAEAGVATAT